MSPTRNALSILSNSGIELKFDSRHCIFDFILNLSQDVVNGNLCSLSLITPIISYNPFIANFSSYCNKGIPYDAYANLAL